ncbi:NADH dehydrogenase [ubiquinone] 1 alpha subcomplex assembly factor 3 isoform X1 [Coturnix japonica]|uniref:NADH dehydrogenase [ubiquinone] 1 alpha subcomplex assembly factor 3 isoform X1 n=1 Tax=Coturnix japonica TaxID=93934 RepID=UPI0013A5BE2F|nr:NADH dehydrogenase [ubiquinone] 1 alpha subcomplex assembly factor 3 isoform X1 [Coturnix japonica]
MRGSPSPRVGYGSARTAAARGHCPVPAPFLPRSCPVPAPFPRPRGAAPRFFGRPRGTPRGRPDAAHLRTAAPAAPARPLRVVPGGSAGPGDPPCGEGLRVHPLAAVPPASPFPTLPVSVLLRSRGQNPPRADPEPAEPPPLREPPAARAPRRGHRLTPSDDEMYQRTRVTVLQPESPNSAFIEGYSCRGFSISGSVVVGPCAVLPRAILQWNVGSHRDISPQSLALFRLLEPRIEILVLGTGDRVEQLHPAVLRQMRLCGIAVEVQDTPNACATFNFLTSEKRLTAAGLIPPRGIYTGLPALPAATD